MTDSTAIDVLMSFKNNKPFLYQAMSCILNQSFSNFRFYICDDGSVDGGHEIIESFQDERIVFIRHEQSQGLSASLNELVALGNSPYLIRMDGDDLCHLERFSKQLNWFREYPQAGILGTYYDWIFSGGRLYKKPNFPPDNELLPMIEQGETPLAHATIMIPRAVFEDAGGYRPAVGTVEDLDLYLRVSKKYSLHIFPEYLYSWRVYPYSTVTFDLLHNRQAFTQLFGKKFGATQGAEDGLRQWARRIAADGFCLESLRFLWAALKVKPFSMMTWKYLVTILLGRAKADSVVSWYDK